MMLSMFSVSMACECCLFRAKFLIISSECECFIFVFYYFSFFTRFSFSGGQFDLVSPVFVYFSADTLLSPTLFISANSFFDMSGDAVGVRIGYSRAELVSFWTPEQRIDRKTQKNLFYHQLWCPRFRRIDKRYDLRRNHRFGGPGAFFVSARRSTLGVGVINARSLNQKHASIHDCISEFSLDILAVTECWHSDDQDLILRRAVPNGYSVLAVSRAESDVIIGGKAVDGDVRGGGVAIMHRDCWKSSRIRPQHKCTSFEVVCARVDVKPTSVVVCNIYRSQPITDKFFDEFRRLLEQLATYRCPLVIVGDFNVHLEKADCTHTKRFNRLLKSFGLHQHVADPTHNQGGILDVFITRNDLPNPDLFVHAPSISDHSLIEGHLPIQPENVFETFTTRSWRKFDKTKFKQDLSTSNFFSQDSNWANFTIDELFSNYNLILRTLLDKHLPVRKMTRRVEPLTPWFDADCVGAKRNVFGALSVFIIVLPSCLTERNGWRLFVPCMPCLALRSVLFGRRGLSLLQGIAKSAGEP